MKKVLVLFCFSLFIIACNSEQKSTDAQTKVATKNNINTLLNNWHKAAANANYKNYFTKMDSLSVFIGTDATENWNKNEFKAYSKPHFNKGKAWSFKTLERNIYLNKTNNFAWFDELLNTQMGTCRGSGVLEKTNNTWKIKHYVLSITIPNNDVKAVISAKQKNDSIFLQKFK